MSRRWFDHGLRKYWGLAANNNCSDWRLSGQSQASDNAFRGPIRHVPALPEQPSACWLFRGSPCQLLHNEQSRARPQKVSRGLSPRRPTRWILIMKSLNRCGCHWLQARCCLIMRIPNRGMLADPIFLACDCDTGQLRNTICVLFQYTVRSTWHTGQVLLLCTINPLLLDHRMYESEQ